MVRLVETTKGRRGGGVMAHFERRSELTVPAATVFEWHAREGAFERLVPPWERVRVVARAGLGVTDGSSVTLQMKRGPIPLTWVARHRDVVPGRQFRDEQVRGPFKHWVHTHRFDPLDAGRSELLDEIEYALPFGLLGRWVGGRSVARDLERTFAFRHRRTERDLLRHARSSLPPSRIAITGASGMIGTALTHFLSTGGHTVQTLVRRPARPDADEIEWDPAAGVLEARTLEGLQAVVHLAGANVAAGRWTGARKEATLRSRVDSTRLLATRLSELDRKPSVLVCASAIGIYGNRPGEEVDESSLPGAGFLADVCRDWEDATRPAEAAGIRVVHARIGIVISRRGGALPRLLTPFRLGLGGPVGSGRQVMSWVALDDVVGALHHAIAEPRLMGPVNVVAPEPVDNRTFAKTLGRVLRRPAVLPLPAFAVKALFGQMGESLLLSGAFVRPSRLLETGFAFGAPLLEGALREELGR